MSISTKAIKYWNDTAGNSIEDARDAVLIGFKDEKSFDLSGKEDAQALILPFIEKSFNIVDIGCGIGRLAKYVAPHCKNMLCLDISKEMLAIAKKRMAGANNAQFKVLSPALNMEIKSGSIDFAYFYHVSEHMDRENAFKIIQEIFRILKPKGRALIQFSVIDFEDNQKEFLKWARLGDDEGVRSRFYTELECNIMLQMAKLHPQYRIYIPGEFAVIVTKQSDRVLGEMPGFTLKNNLG